MTAAEHQAAVDKLVEARQKAPTESNRILLALAVAAQTAAAGGRK